MVGQAAPYDSRSVAQRRARTIRCAKRSQSARARPARLGIGDSQASLPEGPEGGRANEANSPRVLGVPGNPKFEARNSRGPQKRRTKPIGVGEAGAIADWGFAGGRGGRAGARNDERSQFRFGRVVVDTAWSMAYDTTWQDNRGLCGGDWCLVVPLVFKTSVGPRRSRVGSIPIRLRHFYRAARRH